MIFSRKASAAAARLEGYCFLPCSYAPERRLKIRLSQETDAEKSTPEPFVSHFRKALAQERWLSSGRRESFDIFSRQEVGRDIANFSNTIDPSKGTPSGSSRTFQGSLRGLAAN